jgi:hypothetical protein
VLVVLGVNVVRVFHAFSSELLRWRRCAALSMQVGMGIFMVFISPFGLDSGLGFWVTLPGFVVETGSPFLS